MHCNIANITFNAWWQPMVALIDSMKEFQDEYILSLLASQTMEVQREANTEYGGNTKKIG